MTPDLRRLCEAVENAVPMIGQHTVTGRTEEIVRAVLNELREPSEAMRAAGQAGQRAFEAMPGSDTQYLSAETYTFVAMIDSILTGPT